MPTAPAEVRAVARYIAPPLEDEGAGQMIEALALASPSEALAASRRLAAEAAEQMAAEAVERQVADGMTARVVGDDQAGRAVAIEVLRDGGVVALPTDTVYGIGVALETPGGIERLFAAKRRPPDKGIMLLLDVAAQAAAIGVMTPAAAALAAACWPGGLTIVVPRRPEVSLPAALTGGAPTIGLRVPDHDAPRSLAALSAVAGHLGERVRCPGGGRCGRHPRAARRRGGSRPRRRSRPWRSAVDRRRLHRGAAGHPAGGAIPEARIAAILDAAGVDHDLGGG
jgi:tRNA A37 threonylcarbamoyladenosine synthetase subunit TsaC/SUA5/YrdC